MGWKLCTLSTKPPDNGDGAIVVDWKQKLNQHNGKKLKSGIWTTKHNNVSGRFCFLACGTIISGSSATLACTCVHQQLTQSHSFGFGAGFILKHTLYCFAIAGQRWLWKRCIFHQANHWRLEKKIIPLLQLAFSSLSSWATSQCDLGCGSSSAAFACQHQNCDISSFTMFSLEIENQPTLKETKNQIGDNFFLLRSFWVLTVRGRHPC